MSVINCSVTDTADATFTGLGVRIDVPVTSFADVAGALLLGIVVATASSSGDASASVTAADRIDYITSSANATEVPSTSLSELGALTSSADASNWWIVSQTLPLSSTADASAAVTASAGSADISHANATGTPNFVITHSYTESANGTSAFSTAALLYTFSETADGTSTLALSTSSSVAVTSTADAGSSVVPDHHATVEVQERGAAYEVLSTSLTALSNFRARADATDRITTEALEGSVLWMNTESTAGAHWAKYPFNSFALHTDGHALGAGDGGIYLLEGDNDAGVPIVADVRTDLLDFDSPLKKRLDGMLVAGTSAAPIRVAVTDEQGTFTYDTHLASAATQRNNRAQLGRGLAASYFRFGFSNPAGDDFSVDEVRVQVGETKRSR